MRLVRWGDAVAFYSACSVIGQWCILNACFKSRRDGSNLVETKSKKKSREKRKKSLLDSLLLKIFFQARTLATLLIPVGH